MKINNRLIGLIALTECVVTLFASHHVNLFPFFSLNVTLYQGLMLLSLYSCSLQLF